jgi:hypothetical protein
MINQIMPEDWDTGDAGRLEYRGYRKINQKIPDDKKFNPVILFNLSCYPAFSSDLKLEILLKILLSCYK